MLTDTSVPALVFALLPSPVLALLPSLTIALCYGVFVACAPAVWSGLRRESADVTEASLATWQEWVLQLVLIYGTFTFFRYGLGSDSVVGFLRAGSCILFYFHFGGAALTRQLLAREATAVPAA